MLLEVCSRRWGHNDRYKIRKTDSGWYITHISINGPCDKTGNPYLFENLRQDSINYPRDLGGYMEYLWERASAENMSKDDIQKQLDLLGEWIQTTEKATPGGFFSEY